MTLENILKNSKEVGLRVAFEVIPIAWGAAVSSFGKSINEPIIPVVPLVYDLMWNAEGYFTPRGMWNLLKYGIGVALPYADKVYPVIENWMREL